MPALNFNIDDYKWNYNDEWVDMKNKYNSAIDFLKTMEVWVKNEKDDVSGNLNDLDFSQYAKVDSPHFTGNPMVTTPDKFDNSEKIATTEWVDTRIQDYCKLDSPNFSGIPTVPTPALDDNSVQIANTEWVNLLLSTYYTPINNPYFKGNPTATTPLTDNNSQRIATTAFVHNKLESVLSNYVPLNSPSLVGEPTVPTPSPESNSLQIANTEWVNNKIRQDINSATTNLKETVVISGVIDDNGTITPPVGFDITQCRCTVSLNSLNIENLGIVQNWDIAVSVDASGKVTCYADVVSSKGSFRVSGKANYLCIAQK